MKGVISPVSVGVIFLALALVPVLPTAYGEELVYGNSDASQPTGGAGASANFSSDAWQALNFDTGSSSLLSLDEGWVLLRNSQGADVTLTAAIYADGSDVPTGSALGSTTFVVTNNGQDSWRNFVFSTPISLSSATEYWLVLSYISTVQVNWLLPDSSTTTYSAFNGSGYQVPTNLLRGSSADGTTWATGGPAQMGMQLGASVSPVPEPGTGGFLIAAAALAVTSGLRRRRTLH